MPASLRKKFCKIQKKFCIVIFVLFKGNILPYNQTKVKIQKIDFLSKLPLKNLKIVGKYFPAPFEFFCIIFGHLATVI